MNTIHYTNIQDKVLFPGAPTQITLVSGFYDINRGSWWNSSRSTDKYIQAFHQYLTIPYKMVIFMDDRYIDRLSIHTNQNITLIPINMEWLQNHTQAWKQLDLARQITESAEYTALTKTRKDAGEPQNLYPEYCLINHTKIDFIKYAIDNSLVDKEDFICWSDFGYYNSILHFNSSEFPSRELDYRRFNLTKLCFFLLQNITEYDTDPVNVLTKPNCFFTGSFWGGPASLLLELHWLYTECLNELYALNISDQDQHIYLRCYLKRPDLFELFIDSKWPQVLTDFQQTSHSE